jgi:hypothetical protein
MRRRLRLGHGDPTRFDPKAAYAQRRQVVIKMTLGAVRFEAAVAGTRAKLDEDFRALQHEVDQRDRANSLRSCGCDFEEENSDHIF